jgi:hypothetical protein
MEMQIIVPKKLLTPAMSIVVYGNCPAPSRHHKRQKKNRQAQNHEPQEQLKLGRTLNSTRPGIKRTRRKDKPILWQCAQRSWSSASCEIKEQYDCAAFKNLTHHEVITKLDRHWQVRQ